MNFKTGNAHRRWRQAANWLLSLSVFGALNGAVAGVLPATNVWKVEVGFGCESSPAVAPNGVIYVASHDGQLHAINPDGTRRWIWRGALEMVSSPAIGTDGTVYVGSRDRNLYAVDADGRNFKTGAWVDASAALGEDGTIYFGSWDKKFYALNPDGTKKWEFPTGGPIVSSAAIDAGGVIYFGSHDKKFYALNPDGSKRWEFVAGGPIISSPAIAADGTVYFTSVDGRLRALNPDGTKRWELLTGGVDRTSPVIGADGTLYLAGHTNVLAVDAAGKIKWQWPLGNQYPGLTTEATWAVLANGNIVTVPGDGLAVAMKPEPEAAWYYWLDGWSHSSPAVAADGTVYLLGLSSHLHAVQGISPLAASAWPMFRADPQHTGRVRPER
jgi:outer membrane protein assembly factor BamB